MRKNLAALAAILCLSGTLPGADAASTRSPQQLAETVIRLPYLARELVDGYKVKESQVADAKDAALGVKALSGFDLQGPPGPFNTVFVFYNFFDSAKLAEAYANKAHEAPDGTYETVDRNIKIGGAPGVFMSPSVEESCSVSSDTDLSLICTILEPRIPAVVVLMLAPGPAASGRRNGELPVNTALRMGGSDRMEGLVPPVLHQLARATIGN